MRNIQDFLAWGISHASPARIPAGSVLCVPLSHVGSGGIWQYLYGTTGVICTQARLDYAYNKYYKTDKFGAWTRSAFDRTTAGWVTRGVMVCDCQGLEDHYSKSDTNAKGNYDKYCTDKGRIADIKRPYIIGEALFVGSSPTKINHVGWVVGFAPDGEPLILHERGLAHGCVIERMSACDKKWSYRGLMTKRYSYGEAPAPNPNPNPEQEEPKVGKVITKNLKYDAGIELYQQALNALGYPCGKADGKAGDKTMAAHTAFVAAHSTGQALPEGVSITVEVGGVVYRGDALKAR